MSDLGLKSPGVGDFVAAANSSSGEDDKLQLRRGDKQGVATSGWERFRVRWSNFWSRGSTVTRRQKETAEAFRNAIIREYGTGIWDQVRSGLSNALRGNTPLTARMVRDTVDLITARGGKAWMHNERVVGEMSGPLLFRSGEPPFSGILQEVRDTLLPEARARGLPEPYLRRLEEMYAIPEDRLHLNPHQARLAHAVRVDLRYRGGDGMGYRMLGESDEEGERNYDGVRDHARDKVREILLQGINAFQHQAYVEAHGSLQDAFNVGLHARGLTGALPPEVVTKLMGEVEESFDFFIRSSENVLTPEQLGVRRQQAIDRALDRVRDKHAALEALALPSGPAREELVKFVQGMRMSMDGGYFARALTVAVAVRGGLEAIRNAPTPQQREEALKNLGRIFAEATVGMLGDEQDTFAQVVRLLLHARSPDDGRAVRELMAQPEMFGVHRDFSSLRNQMGAGTEEETRRLALISNGLKVMTEFSPREPR